MKKTESTSRVVEIIYNIEDNLEKIDGKSVQKACEVVFKLPQNKGECNAYRGMYKKMVLKLLDITDIELREKNNKTSKFYNTNHEYFFKVYLENTVDFDINKKSFYENQHKIYQTIAENNTLGEGGMGVVDSAAVDGGGKVALKKALKEYKIFQPKSDATIENNRLFKLLQNLLECEYKILEDIHKILSKQRKDVSTVVKPLKLLKGTFKFTKNICVNEVVMVLEYIEGDTVEEYCKKFHEKASMSERNDVYQYTSAEMLAIFCGMAESIKDVHYTGYTHRDIKLSNFMVGKKSGVTVLDFGLSDEKFFLKKMDEGQIFGSINYTPIIDIYDYKTFNHLSDIFSLGICFHNVMCGKDVFPDLHNIWGRMNIYKNLHENNESLPFDFPKNADAELTYLITKMCELDPANRKIENKDITAKYVLQSLQRLFAKHVLIEYKRYHVSNIYNKEVKDTYPFLTYTLLKWIGLHAKMYITNPHTFFDKLDIYMTFSVAVCEGALSQEGYHIDPHTNREFCTIGFSSFETPALKKTKEILKIKLKENDAMCHIACDSTFFELINHIFLMKGFFDDDTFQE